MEYLNISLDCGKVLELAEKAKALILEDKQNISIAAFENNNEKGPSFKGPGVAVWKNTKEEKVSTSVEDI